MNKTHKKKPDWLRIKVRYTKEFQQIESLVRDKKIHTVCREADCPNMCECWGKLKTATFMILGDICTRGCRFCSVKTGIPLPPDPEEPKRIAEAVKALNLAHAVITMVTRDDLEDGGAGQMAAVVREIKKLSPDCSVELLSSDMKGSENNIAAMLEAKPDILSHNLETVERLTLHARANADYHRSLDFFTIINQLSPGYLTKSSLMVGLGETLDEIKAAMKDLREKNVNILNIGQYLQPTLDHLPVERFWTPEEFTELKEVGLEMGFTHVEAAPLVRSSYHAAMQVEELKNRTES